MHCADQMLLCCKICFFVADQAEGAPDSHSSESSSSDSPEAEQEQLNTPVTRSATKGIHQASTQQGSQKKKAAVSTGKAVRFSDSVLVAMQADEPSNADQASDHDVTASASPSAEDSASPPQQPRSTRSGHLHRGPSIKANIKPASAEPAPAASHAPCDLETSNSTRATRSGRLFAAKPASPHMPTDTTDHPAGVSHAAATAEEGPCTSADDQAAEPSTSAAAEEASDAAAEAASSAGGVSQPWKQSLLGMGLSLTLPEETRWPDRGRPSTDHPRHKNKSASMMRR